MKRVQLLIVALALIAVLGINDVRTSNTAAAEEGDNVHKKITKRDLLEQIREASKNFVQRSMEMTQEGLDKLLKLSNEVREQMSEKLPLSEQYIRSKYAEMIVKMRETYRKSEEMLNDVIKIKND